MAFASRSNRPCSFVAVLLLAAVMGSCTVDNRILSTGQLGTSLPGAGASSDASFSARDSGIDTSADASSLSDEDAGNAPEGSGGSNGHSRNDAATSSIDGGPIDDLPVDDCENTALQLDIVNTAFDSNGAGWDVDSTANKDWSSEDSSGDSSSGSLTVTNKRADVGAGLNAAGVSQCLQIPQDVGYHVCVDYLISNTAPENAAVTVNLVLFNGQDCSGTVSTSPSIPAQGEKGGWHTFKARMNAPPQNSSFKSMLFKLVAIKPNEAPPLDVQFDNVRVGLSTQQFSLD